MPNIYVNICNVPYLHIIFRYRSLRLSLLFGGVLGLFSLDYRENRPKLHFHENRLRKQGLMEQAFDYYLPIFS
jgi:hypothetical protein